MILHSIFLIVYRDIVTIGRDYKKFLILLLLPLMVIFLMAAGFKYLFQRGVYIDTFEIVVINQDSHPLSNLLIQQIQEDEKLKELLHIQFIEDEIEGEKRVKDGLAVAAVVIPDGFMRSLETGTNHSVKLITSKSQPLKSHIIKSIMDSYMKSVSGGQSAVNAVWKYYRDTDMSYQESSKKIDRVIQDITMRIYFARSNVFEKKTVAGINSLSSFEFYFTSVMIIFLMFSALSAGKSIIEDEKTKVLDRLKLTGVSGFTYVMGKFISTIIIGVLQSLPIFMIAVYFLVGGIGIKYLYMMLLYTIIILTIAALSLMGTVLVKSQEQMDIMGNITIFIMTLIGGGIIPYIYFPTPLQYLSKFTIHYWCLNGMLNFLQGSIKEGIISIVLLLTIGIIGFLFSWYLYSKQEGWLGK